MATLRIEFPEWDRDNPPSALSYMGTQVYLDGQPIKGVVNFSLDVTTGHVVQATIDVNAIPETIEVPADVTVNVIPPDDED